MPMVFDLINFQIEEFLNNLLCVIVTNTILLD